jgi:hypothetical protein
MQGEHRDAIPSLSSENVMHLDFNPISKQKLILVAKEMT